MQQIADKVGVHVTTVSRAVDDKWIQTPRGIFPLKRFFAGGTTTAAGEEVAWDTVRLKLQEVIDKEDKQHPLSDDDLVLELAKHGLTVARRTVTKYRKLMKIPSSRSSSRIVAATVRISTVITLARPRSTGRPSRTTTRMPSPRSSRTKSAAVTVPPRRSHRRPGSPGGSGTNPRKSAHVRVCAHACRDHLILTP